MPSTETNDACLLSSGMFLQDFQPNLWQSRQGIGQVEKLQISRLALMHMCKESSQERGVTD